MTNRQIYNSTFVFSWHRLLIDLLGFLILIAATLIGFLVVGDSILGMAGGFLVGIILFAILVHFLSYLNKAGQIAMMTRAIVDGSLPENVYAEGKKAVKDRFGTVTAYYAATGLINGIFNELTNGINSLGKMGGESGEAIGSTISAVIHIAVAYLCDCCLGWVFYRKEKSSFRATCEGAVLYFKNWKTLLKNMGRIIAFGILSFILIGGAFSALSYVILGNFPGVMEQIAEIAVEADSDLSGLADPQVALLFCSILIGLLFWGILHAVFVRPLVLVGVLRNYINAGMEAAPSESDMESLDHVSKKFKKAHLKAETA